jgi:hypothetical protein
MSPHASTEDQLVEQPAIALFAELGWQTVAAMEKVRRVASEQSLDIRLRFVTERTENSPFCFAASRLCARRFRFLSIPIHFNHGSPGDFTDANRRTALGCLRCLL